MYPGRAPSIQNRLRVKHNIHCRQLQKSMPLSCFIHIILMAQLLLSLSLSLLLLLLLLLLLFLFLLLHCGISG